MSTVESWLRSGRKRPLDFVDTRSHRIPICDDNLVHVTDYIRRSDWMSFLMVSKQFLRCGSSHASGITPAYNNYECLRWACRNGKRWSIITLLKDPRCDWCFNQDYLNTPLGEAAHGGWHTICKLLLDHGIDLNFTDYYQENSLMDALRGHSCYKYQTCELLLKAKADVTQINTYGLTPLQLADLHQVKTSVVELLKTYGAK